MKHGHHVSKRTIEKAHEIAKAIQRERPSVVTNPYAVGMAVAKKTRKR